MANCLDFIREELKKQEQEKELQNQNQLHFAALDTARLEELKREKEREEKAKNKSTPPPPSLCVRCTLSMCEICTYRQFRIQLRHRGLRP